MNLLRTLRQVGPGVVRVIPGALSAAARAFQKAPEPVERALEEDQEALYEAAGHPSYLWGYLNLAEGAATGQAPELYRTISTNLTQDDTWLDTAYRLECLVANTDWVAGTGGLDIAALIPRFAAKPEAYFRWYHLNQGRNDHWEYYLTPWLRSYRTVGALLCDPRTEVLGTYLWERFDQFAHERPWMRRIPVGSNIAAVSAGYALHHLFGVLLDDSIEGRQWHADQYILALRRFDQVLRAAFSHGIPHEGVSYGTFFFLTAGVLAWVQQRMGMAYQLLQQPTVTEFLAYLTVAQLDAHHYDPSGDHTDAHVSPLLAALGNRRELCTVDLRHTLHDPLAPLLW